MNVSFIHRGGPTMASFRYRALMPALQIGAILNDPTADVVIYAKPMQSEVPEISNTFERRTVIVDFCDDHFDLLHYKTFAACANHVTCPTDEMAKVIREKTGREATVIPDCYESDEHEPHCNGDKLLWFGHASNIDTLFSLGEMKNLTVISNARGCIPWSLETTRKALLESDIFVLPATKAYKSPDRALEAIRMGCFVAADPHPSLVDIPCWKWGVKEGVEWALHNKTEANALIRQGQDYIRERYAPRTLVSAWRTLIRSLTTSAAEESAGRDGPTSILQAATLTAT